MPELEQPPEKRPAQSSGSRIAIIAIILAIIAIALSTWQIQNNSILLNDTKQEVHLIKNNIAQLQNNQHRLTQKALANTTYLVHLANLQLTIGHDPESALKSALLAQQSLQVIDGDAFDAAKQALSSDIAALKTIPVIDVNKIFSNIATLAQQVQALSMLPDQPKIPIQNTINQIKSVEKNLPWYDRVFESLKQLKHLFVIRRLDQPIAQVITPEQENSTKQLIAMQLSLAQWALLQRDNNAFHAALGAASQYLARYFAFTDAKNALLSKLSDLDAIQIGLGTFTLQNTINALSAAKIAQPAAIQKPITPEKLPTPEKPNDKKDATNTNPAAMET